MASAHTTNNAGDGSTDQEDHQREEDSAAARAGDAAGDTTCPSGSSQPRQPSSAAVTTARRSPLFDAATGPGRQDSDAVLAVSDNYPRCDRHDDRNAEVYCQTCYVSVCLICATTRHLPTHHCLDIVDAVDECRSILARHASDLTQTCWNCLTGIEDTNVRIESIRSETDKQEMLIRRHFEELRMRLEQDFNRLIQDLETSKNSRIKQLAKLRSELQANVVKLEGQSHQMEQLSVHGTAVQVIEKCAHDAPTTALDLLLPIPQLPTDHHVQPQFTKSDLLQKANNLVGQLTRTPADDNPVEQQQRGWSCRNCTFDNQPEDIVCQMCDYTPLKEDRTLSEGFAGRDNHTSPTWTCGSCTVINHSAANKCMTCDMPRLPPPRNAPRSPNNFETAVQNEYVIPVPVLAAAHSRTPSPRNAAGNTISAVAVSEAKGTQTEDVDTGKPSVLGRLRQLLPNRRTPTSSRDSSPQANGPRVDWPAATDGASARWACSQCACDNGMDRTECEQCGYEEQHPSASISFQ